MRRFALRRNNQAGFTLIETIIAAAMAAVGFALVFQGLGGAVRLVKASAETERTLLVAKSVMAQSTLTPGEIHLQGITNGIAWTLNSSILIEREDGVKLFRYTLLAEGATGRQLRLVTERTAAP
jgi:prepilin-type N-terminal cleavage/methylation domain-containing protein